MPQPATIRKIMKELGQLRSDPPEDIRVQVDEEDMLQFVGIIAGPEGTPYHGGYFRIRFTFGDDFPASPPKCFFTTKIFHPNVSSSGDICVNTLKKDWKSTYGIGHILTVIKCLLIYPNPESALDEEAGKMLLDDYEGYCKRAKLMTSIHATRGGRPIEFEDPAKQAALAEDPLAISFLEGPSTSSATGTSASRDITASIAATTRLRHGSTSPVSSSVTLPFIPIVPPLRSSAQSNGAPRLSPAPSEKDLITGSATSLDTKKRVPSSSRESSKLPGTGVGKSLKRPASAVAGGIKENGSGAEKRKKGLKRL